MLIIFDVDGTLVDSDKLLQQREHAHIDYIAQKYKTTIDKAKEKFKEAKAENKLLGKHSTLDAMLRLGISENDFYGIMNAVPINNNVIPISHVKVVLETLSQQHTLITLSATPFEASIRTLESVDIKQYFQAFYCPDQYNFTKPSVDIYKRIFADFQSTIGYSVGDSVEKDLLPAREVGLTTVLFSQKQDKRIDYTISDFRELIRICQLREDK